MIFPLRGERVAAMRRRVRGFSTLWQKIRAGFISECGDSTPLAPAAA